MSKETETLMTVAEYASFKGISPQAVYKQLNKNKLKTVEKVECGKRVKFILVNNDFSDAQTEDLNQPNQPRETNQTNQINQPIQPSLDSEFLQYLKEENEQLKKQLEEKDKQLLEYAIKFADLAAQAQQIAGQAQVLHLSEKTDIGKEIDSGRKTESEEEKEDNTAATARKGLFRRIFRL